MKQRVNRRGRDVHLVLVCCCLLAGERGFEPRLTDPKTVVLPLDDSPARNAVKLGQPPECTQFAAVGQVENRQ
jgi:hypothetical protein